MHVLSCIFWANDNDLPNCLNKLSLSLSLSSTRPRRPTDRREQWISKVTILKKGVIYVHSYLRLHKLNKVCFRSSVQLLMSVFSISKTEEGDIRLVSFHVTSMLLAQSEPYHRRIEAIICYCLKVVILTSSKELQLLVGEYSENECNC